MGWATPSSWGNPRQKVGVLNKYKLLSIIVSTSKYLRASDNIIYIVTILYPHIYRVQTASWRV